jgi:hypothetical protein
VGSQRDHRLMTNIIDLEAERLARDVAPDLVTEEDGERWYQFSLSYTDDDKQYSFSIWAKDAADAERRAGLIRQGLTLDGRLLAREPA